MKMEEVPAPDAVIAKGEEAPVSRWKWLSRCRLIGLFPFVTVQEAKETPCRCCWENPNEVDGNALKAIFAPNFAGNGRGRIVPLVEGNTYEAFQHRDGYGEFQAENERVHLVRSLWRRSL